MIYGSVCSGIEAATTAWHPLGWKAAFFSEIAGFPRALLQHHYPETPLHGDFTTIEADEYGSIDLLVGGTPCQSFSIAGLRAGLDDDRGNLAREFLRLAQRTRPLWVVWENVPGVLSSNGGRDFGSLLGGLGELGYGWAYRVLDAQYFGVAQRRRRVFVVGCLRGARYPQSVLFERHSLSGNPAPRRGSEKRPLPSIGGSTNQTVCVDDVAGCMPYQDHYGVDTQSAISGYVQPVAVQSNANVDDALAAAENVSPSMRAQGDPPAVAFAQNQRGEIREMEVAGALSAFPGAKQQTYTFDWAVRRLTPLECERLQGFPDNYTRIPWRNRPAEDCYDGPRYKALGNSMAVPVMRWIGERIQACQTLLNER